MSHANATFDANPQWDLPRWNPALNILAPLVGIVLLAALIAAPSLIGSGDEPSSGAVETTSGPAAALADGFDPFGLYRTAAADLVASD